MHDQKNEIVSRASNIRWWALTWYP